MNAVLEAAHKGDRPIYTLGPLVHNQQAMAMLAAKSVTVVSKAEEAREGILFIRAHGVAPSVRDSLERAGLEVVDMTCPHVRRAQKIIEGHAAQGFHTLIVGDPGHAEVVGLLGHAEGRGHVVSGPEDIAALPDLSPVCVVAQTTQNSQRFEELLPLIQERFPGAVVHNTVCRATDDRQAEVRDLAREVDAVIVVGGRHSANTVRLAEVAREEGVATYLVETASELDPVALSGHRTIGVTAGASTPHWVFRAVVDRAEQLQRSRSPLSSVARALLALAVHSFLFIGVGSAGLTYAALRLLEIQPRFALLFQTFMYVVSMHLINRFTDRVAAQINDPQRMALLQNHRPVFLAAAVGLGLGALAIAFTLGSAPFVLMLFSLAAGIGYNLPLIPAWLARLTRFQAVKEIPGSKDIFLALAWATVAVLIPYLAERNVNPGAAVAVFVFVFLLVFIRSIVYGMKDLEGDRLVGKETFPLILGQRNARILLVSGAAFLVCIGLADAVFAWSPLRGFFFLPLASAVALYLILCFRRVVTQGLGFELVVDAPFVLAGLLAFGIPYS